eukprot:3690150-Amphidinium_carterae.1
MPPITKKVSWAQTTMTIARSAKCVMSQTTETTTWTALNAASGHRELCIRTPANTLKPTRARTAHSMDANY